MQHSEWEEQVGLLAIDALDAAPAEAVRAHLRACASCLRLMEEYQVVTQALLEQVPPQEPPRGMESRMRARLRARQPVPPSAVRRFWESLFALPRWTVAATAAVVLLVLVGGLVLVQRMAGIGANASPEVAQILNAPGRVTAELAGTDQAPAARGQLVMVPAGTAAVLILNDMAPLPADKGYQVWLIHDGVRDTGGVISVAGRGQTIALIRAPLPMRSYQQVGLTVEPAAGSPGPTTPRVIGGKLP